MFRNTRLFTTIVSLMLCLCAGVALAVPPVASVAGYTIDTYLDAPAGESLVSYDWDAAGALYYLCGDPNWGMLLKVHRRVGAVDTVLMETDTVFAGSRIAAVGNYVYFNDGGDYSRYSFNYFAYDVVGGGNPALMLDSTQTGAPSLWGAETIDGTQFFASGAVDFGPSALFYTPMNSQGTLDGLVNLGQIGESSGPIAFDAQGNLYYAHGYVYSGQAQVFRWTAQEVANAIANPVLAPLLPAGHTIAELPATFTGASGMAVDGCGNVYVTANAFGEPGELCLFRADGQGGLGEAEVLAQGGDRLDTLRLRDGRLFVSSPAGIFSLPLPLSVKAASGATLVEARAGKQALLAVEAFNGDGPLGYHWYREDGAKANTPVGGNSPILSITAAMNDDGAAYFCTVSDVAISVDSPRITLHVLPTVSVTGTAGFALLAALLVLAAVARLRRQAGAAISTRQ